ncbi:MAG: MarR family transcriptional regulator [Pseudomonadota bacterium]
MTRFTDDYLLALMAQASSAISADFHRWLAEERVTVATWRALASLYPDQALTVGELSASCLAKQPTMTRRIDRLAAEGLVERIAGDGDRRRVLVRLTAVGRARAATLVAEAQAHERRLLATYSPAEAAALKTLLRGLRDGVVGASERILETT